MHAQGLLPDMHTHIYIPDFETEVPTFLDHLAFFSDFCWRRLADVPVPTCFCAPKSPDASSPLLIGDLSEASGSPHTRPLFIPDSVHVLTVAAGAQKEAVQQFPDPDSSATHAAEEAHRGHSPQGTEKDPGQVDGAVSIPVHSPDEALGGAGTTTLVPLVTGRDRGAQGSLGDPGWFDRWSKMMARDTDPQWAGEHVRWSKQHKDDGAISSENHPKNGRDLSGSVHTHRLSVLSQLGELGEGVTNPSQQPQTGSGRGNPSERLHGQTVEDAEEGKVEMTHEEAQEAIPGLAHEVALEQPHGETSFDGTRPGSALQGDDSQSVQRLWVPQGSVTRRRLLLEETTTSSHERILSIRPNAWFWTPPSRDEGSIYANLQQVLRKGLLAVRGYRRRLGEAPSSQRSEGPRGRPEGDRMGSPRRNYQGGTAAGGQRVPAPDLRTQALQVLGVWPEQAPSRPRLALVARTAKRLLLNVRELGEAARQMDIPTSILPLEALTVYEQIMALQSSTVLAAMHGAALCTAVWLPANATVIQVAFGSPRKPSMHAYAARHVCTHPCSCVRTCSCLNAWPRECSCLKFPDLELACVGP